MKEEEKVIIDLQADNGGLDGSETPVEWLQPQLNREPPKITDNVKELRRFRGQRTAFIWIVLGVIIVHNIGTILLMIYVISTPTLNISLDILIPSYFINVTAQVFALMKAFAAYFDKAEFLDK